MSFADLCGSYSNIKLLFLMKAWCLQQSITVIDQLFSIRMQLLISKMALLRCLQKPSWIYTFGGDTFSEVQSILKHRQLKYYKAPL